MEAERIPRWESELWSYMSSGDGEQCPLYGLAQENLHCTWCISEHKEYLCRLLDTRNFDPCNYDFMEFVKPGRIFTLVEKLAQKYLTMGNICSPPVPDTLVELCDWQRAVEVRVLPLKLYQGAIWCMRDRWIIYLNDDLSPDRKRFTTFHEAFHILAHCKASPVFRKRGCERGAFNELLAEYFSTCTLMPRDWVKEKWAEVKEIDRMAEIFAVPKAAMWVRLKTLGLI